MHRNVSKFYQINDKAWNIIGVDDNLLYWCVCVCLCAVDLISIDRRSPEREAECLERSMVLAQRFREKVQATDNHMWNPAGSNAAPTQTER